MFGFGLFGYFLCMSSICDFFLVICFFCFWKEPSLLWFFSFFLQIRKKNVIFLGLVRKFQWQSIVSFSSDFFFFPKVIFKKIFFFQFSDLGCSNIDVVLCLCPLKIKGFFKKGLFCGLWVRSALICSVLGFACRVCCGISETWALKSRLF